MHAIAKGAHAWHSCSAASSKEKGGSGAHDHSRHKIIVAAAEFASAQSDAYVNPERVGDPEGGWEDDEDTLDATWEEEAWDYSGA